MVLLFFIHSSTIDLISGLVRDKLKDQPRSVQQETINELKRILPDLVKPVGEIAKNKQQLQRQESLQKQYDQEVVKLRRGDVRALEELKRRYRESGLEIW